VVGAVSRHRLTVLNVSLPSAAGGGGAGVGLLDCADVGGRGVSQPCVERVQPCAVLPQLVTQRHSVGGTNVAPHFGRACGDAREVAKAARGIVEVLVGARHSGQHVHQREREQMWQVADGGENVVVLSRTHCVDFSPRGSPHFGYALHRIHVTFCLGADDDFSFRVERGERSGRARFFGASNRVGGYELIELCAKCSACRRDNVLLGAATVGDDARRAEMRSQRGEYLRHLRDRRGDEDDVGLCCFFERRDGVNDVELQRFLKVRSRATDAYNAAHAAFGLQRQR